MKLWHYLSRGWLRYVCNCVCFHACSVLSTISVSDMQAATHLKGRADKAKLNEKHVKIAQIYKAKVASITSERAGLQERAQHMIEEIGRLKSDLKHTSSARARAEQREDEVRSSLAMAEGELREVRGELQVAQNDLVETLEGLQSAQGELQLVREELITSQGEQRDLQAELRAVTSGLNEMEKQLEIARRKVLEGKVLLETARHESSQAVNLSGRLSKECRGLRTELHQRDSMVAQRDEVVRKLRDQAGAQWASGCVAFQRKAIHAYSNLDFNFELPSDEEAGESSDSREPGTPAGDPSHSSSSDA